MYKRMEIEMKAKDLTEVEREVFSELFEDLSDVSDWETSTPWGCPWEHGGQIELEGETMEEKVSNYYKRVREEMKELSLIVKD